jgi:hypothetical protein
LETAIKNASSGDLIVMFYESFETAFKLVQKYIDESYQPVQIPIIVPDQQDHIVEYIQ